eukprot:3634302-Pyramimonas_sp.AAC.1
MASRAAASGPARRWSARWPSSRTGWSPCRRARNSRSIGAGRRRRCRRPISSGPCSTTRSGPDPQSAS